MASLKNDNLIRTVNSYIEDIGKTFGTESREYQQAEKQVFQTLKGTNFQTRTNKYGLLSVKRGKNAETIPTEKLQKLRQKQRKVGTATTQSQKYINELKSTGEPITKENIKNLAQEKYYNQNNSDVFYKENYSMIQENKTLKAQWVKAGKANSEFNKGVSNSEYEKAKELTQAYKDHDMQLIEKLTGGE